MYLWQQPEQKTKRTTSNDCGKNPWKIIAMNKEQKRRTTGTQTFRPSGKTENSERVREREKKNEKETKINKSKRNASIRYFMNTRVYTKGSISVCTERCI